MGWRDGLMASSSEAADTRTVERNCQRFAAMRWKREKPGMRAGLLTCFIFEGI
jgi:hypothetical protein